MPPVPVKGKPEPIVTYYVEDISGPGLPDRAGPEGLASLGMRP